MIVSSTHKISINPPYSDRKQSTTYHSPQVSPQAIRGFLRLPPLPRVRYRSGPIPRGSMTSSILTISRTPKDASCGMLSLAGSRLATLHGRLMAFMNCWRPLQRVDLPELGGPMGTRTVRMLVDLQGTRVDCLLLVFHKGHAE